MVILPTDDISFSPLTELSTYRLSKIWHNKFADKPFPKIVAYILDETEFIILEKRLEVSRNLRNMDMKEYGFKTDIQTNLGCTFRTDAGIIILVKQQSDSGAIDSILEHEMRHIYNGDTEKLE